MISSPDPIMRYKGSDKGWLSGGQGGSIFNCKGRWEICGMAKKTVYTWVLIVVYFFVSGVCFGHGEFENDTGKPVRILDLNDSEGKPFARLFLTGKKMTIDHYDYPASGAGYYEALEGHDYYIPFTSGGLGGLHVERVEWDDSGKTIAVKGLRPFFDGGEQVKITSDVTNPKIQDGILYLKLDDKSGKEYQFKIVFGIGVSITPSLYE